ASSTRQAFPLKGEHGVRSSRSGKPEYYNNHFTIQGCAVRTMEHGSVRMAHPTEHLACPMDNPGL
ncbi:MAG: hypothetical protein WA146_01400, partial [Thiobacillus sp.]